MFEPIGGGTPWDLKLEPGGLGPVRSPIFDGFGDHFGVPPGSLFGHVSFKVVICLQAFCWYPFGEAPGPFLEPKSDEKYRFLRVLDVLQT